MIKAVFIVALLSVLSLVFATEVEESVKSKYLPPCPCTCYTGEDEFLAVKQCKKRIFYYRCKLDDCKVKKYYYDSYHRKRVRYVKGLECCDIKVKPTSTASATPTPKPTCPCKCVHKRRAWKQCRYLHPYCRVTKCPEVHKPHYHGYRPHHIRPKFQCCDHY